MKKFLLAIIASVFCVTAQANMFEADVNVMHDGQTYNHQFAFKTIQLAIDTLSESFLREHFSKYSANDIVYGDVWLRGLKMTFRYSPETSASSNGVLEKLEITIPDAGIDKTFTGTKAEIDQEVKEMFKDGDESVSNKIFQAMVAKTPYDPVAGTPGSMLGNMIDSAFTGDQGYTHNATDSMNVFRLSPTYSTLDEQDNAIRTMSLPLGYAHVFDHGKDTFFINMPLNVTEYDKSQSFSGELGVGLENKLTKNWSLTPEVYAGGLGSEDMGALTVAYAGFLKSQLILPAKRFRFVLTDMVGYMQTDGVKVEDFDTEYGLENTVTDNGLGIGVDFGKFTSLLSYSYVSITGSPWYYPDYSTVKLELSHLRSYKNSEYANLGLQASYSFAGNDYRLFSLGLNYQF